MHLEQIRKNPRLRGSYNVMGNSGLYPYAFPHSVLPPLRK